MDNNIAIWFLTNSILPILLFLLPTFFRSLNMIWGLTQHMGLKEDTKDHRESTRSIRLNPILFYLLENGIPY